VRERVRDRTLEQFGDGEAELAIGGQVVVESGERFEEAVDLLLPNRGASLGPALLALRHCEAPVEHVTDVA